MPGINGLTNCLPTKKIKYLLFLCILCLAVSILVIFVRHRTGPGDTPDPEPPESTKAVLSIQRFRHTATQNGRKQWTLEADSAQLHVDPSEARLINISATFFPETGHPVTIAADHGVLKLDTNNMDASGNIVIRAPEYTIKTENLHYDHQLHMIQSTSPVNVTGSSFLLKAGQMAYHIQTGEITCTNHVEGVFSDISEK